MKKAIHVEHFFDRIDKDAFLTEFRGLVKDDKVKKAGEMLDVYNTMVDAIVELKNVIVEKNEKIDLYESQITAINAVLKKADIPDRIRSIHAIASTLSQILWKLKNVHPT